MSRAPLALREPSHRVSERAVSYWRVQAAALAAGLWLIAAGAIVAAFLLQVDWWTPLLGVGALLCVVVAVGWLAVMPQLSYRVYGWEVTDIAVHVRYGKLSRTDEIVPLSRVQIVDSAQGPLMRYFRLRTVTLQTASSEGAVSIKYLDETLAEEVVARLVTITAATPEDAT